MSEPFEGKKLFIVSVEQSIMVLASDEKEAEQVAKDEAGCGGGIEWNDAMYSAYEGLLYGWGKSLPFGEHPDLTCAEIREAWNEYERTRPRTRAELEAAGQVPLIPEAA